MFVLFCFFLSLSPHLSLASTPPRFVCCVTHPSQQSTRSFHRPITNASMTICCDRSFTHWFRQLKYSLPCYGWIIFNTQSINHVGLKRISRYAESIDRPFTTDQTKINRQIFHIFRHFQFWRINKFEWRLNKSKLNSESVLSNTNKFHGIFEMDVLWNLIKFRTKFGLNWTRNEI